MIINGVVVCVNVRGRGEGWVCVVCIDRYQVKRSILHFLVC